MRKPVKSISETSANRLTIRTRLALTAVIALIAAVAFVACYHAMQAANHVRYAGMANVAAERISKTIRGVEMNAKNVFEEVGKHLDSPEAVVAALESKTSLNPDVRGYFAAFEPDYFPQKGRWFEPYVHHADSSDFEVTMVGSARHDYLKSGWYVRAKSSNDSFWSDPYYYYDGTNISGHYSTFVKPVTDATGRLVCVCGADMTFEWLTKELQRDDDDFKNNDLLNKCLIYSPDDFYTVVVNNDGSCIAHPEGKIVPMTDERVVSDLAARKSGVVSMEVQGVPSTVYYMPIENIGWSVAIVVANVNVPQPLLLTTLALMVLAVAGIIIVWTVGRRRKQESS